MLKIAWNVDILGHPSNTYMDMCKLCCLREQVASFTHAKYLGLQNNITETNNFVYTSV